MMTAATISLDISGIISKLKSDVAVKASKVAEADPSAFERMEMLDNYDTIIQAEIERSIGVLAFTLRRYDATVADTQGGTTRKSFNLNMPECLLGHLKTLQGMMENYIKYQAWYKWYGEILGMQDAQTYIERSNDSLMQIMVWMAKRDAPTRTAPSEKTRESCNFE